VPKKHDGPGTPGRQISQSESRSRAGSTGENPLTISAGDQYAPPTNVDCVPLALTEITMTSIRHHRTIGQLILARRVPKEIDYAALKQAIAKTDRMLQRDGLTEGELDELTEEFRIWRRDRKAVRPSAAVRS